ncbi:MAG TPA: hypothetical protein VN969_31575 [Streptosporangiaceae bacterium]|nr:hypothetical protein [Streptosporangiaceae bacterium]
MRWQQDYGVDLYSMFGGYSRTDCVRDLGHVNWPGLTADLVCEDQQIRFTDQRRECRRAVGA